MHFPASLDRLVHELEKLPSIGPKSARRLAYALVFDRHKNAESLAQAILAAKQNLSICSLCFALAEGGLCPVCANASRDQTQICVVQEPQNIFSIENSLSYNGVYHVLHGVISPIKGIDARQLKIPQLQQRVAEQPVTELILAMNPTVEGEATCYYLKELLQNKIPKITRIACGMPSGSDIEYSDSYTLAQALNGRLHFS